MLARSGPLEISRALVRLEGICRGLYLAHQKGLMLRDVKPANILVPGGDPVQVGDFGLAKVSPGRHAS